MPRRLSKLIPRSSKEKEAEAEAERNTNSSSSSPPPEYAQNPPNYDGDNTIDPPDVTAGFSKLNLNQQSNEIPQVDQCIAHLKVLECFYRLRQQVGSTDGLFGIEDSLVTDKVLVDNDETPQTLSKLSEKRWAIYVSRAVERFEVWSASITPASQPITESVIDGFGKEGRLSDPDGSTPALTFDKDNMPPVDVLMVWHAYMLNPRAYLEDCLRHGRMQLWHSGMPWRAAVDSINSETFAYEAGDGAAKNFTSLTGLPWDNLTDDQPKQLDCPACEFKVNVPYTNYHEVADYNLHQSNSFDDLSLAIDDALSTGSGYCDREFRATCQSCGTHITHERLRANKFCRDVAMLLMDDVPMRGTLLGNEGIPKTFGEVTDILYERSCKFPNRLLKKGLGKKILDGPHYSSAHKQSIEGIRELIEMSLADQSYMRGVRGKITGRMTRQERISIRRMMSRYWDNSSPFAIDLVGAVIRQGSFVEKMHNIDWLHSPALPNTMKRLLIKYQRFMSIMQDKYNMAVPTLDVDLAWHTHQLSPYNYMSYTVHATKQFIDHDDKVAETKLNDAFAWTSKTYQKLYGEPYSECTCWYCEAIRESHTSSASRLFNTNSNQANDMLHNAEQDPRKSVHISAHNAVRPDDKTYQANATRKAQQLEKEYQKACDRARKKGRKPPRRDDFYYSDAWGKWTELWLNWFRDDQTLLT